MSWYALKQYVRYRWHAQWRHGVHSPFVYEYNDRVLTGKAFGKRPLLKDYPAIDAIDFDKRYKELVARMASYYQLENIVLAEGNNNAKKGGIDLLWVSNNYQSVLQQYRPLLSADSIVIVCNPHKTPEQEAAWQKLVRDATIPLTIDLYGIGVLFFRKEFKEKQGFVLRY